MVCVALFLVWGYGEYVGDVADLVYDVYICPGCVLLGRRRCDV